MAKQPITGSQTTVKLEFVDNAGAPVAADTYTIVGFTTSITPPGSEREQVSELFTDQVDPVNLVGARQPRVLEFQMAYDPGDSTDEQLDLIEENEFDVAWQVRNPKWTTAKNTMSFRGKIASLSPQQITSGGLVLRDVVITLSTGITLGTS